MCSVYTKLNQLYEIEKGKGLQYILDQIHDIMGNPALIFDMEYKLIASPTDAENDDPIWCEFMTLGKLNDETIEFFKNESFIDSVANCTQFEGVTYLFSDNLEYDRIFGQLYNGEQLPVADLVMVACENPFEEYTPELIKTACNILSEEISLDYDYKSYGQSYQESIIEKLIEGNISDKGLYSGHVSNIDRGLKSNIFIAVAEMPQTNSAYKNLIEFRDLLKHAEPDFKYSIYSDYVIILISSSKSEIIIEEDLNNLVHLIKKEKINVGISSRFENLFVLQKYYLEAVHALKSAEIIYGGQQIRQYKS